MINNILLLFIVIALSGCSVIGDLSGGGSDISNPTVTAGGGDSSDDSNRDLSSEEDDTFTQISSEENKDESSDESFSDNDSSTADLVDSDKNETPRYSSAATEQDGENNQQNDESSEESMSSATDKPGAIDTTFTPTIIWGDNLTSNSIQNDIHYVNINDTINDTGILIKNDSSLIYEVAFSKDDTYEVMLRANGIQRANTTHYSLDVNLMKSDSSILSPLVYSIPANGNWITLKDTLTVKSGDYTLYLNTPDQSDFIINFIKFTSID